MIKYKAYLLKKGDRLYIVNVDVVDGDAEETRLDVFNNNLNVELTGEMFLYIRSALRRNPDGFNLYITKDQLGTTISDQDQLRYVQLFEADEMSPPSESVLNNARRQLLKRVRRWVGSNTVMLPLILYMYTRAYNHMAINGIMITDENREEKYLEIISKGDDALIDSLADYLDTQDDLAAYQNLLNNYKKAVRLINAATTLDDLRIASVELENILMEDI